MFAACSETEVLEQTAEQQKIENDGAVKFDVYAQRGITRGGGQLGDLTNSNIGWNGFGVFGYYTAGETYSTGSKPNFMYNQQVRLEGATKDNPGVAAFGKKWVYEPVKYWPNEYGNAAISDEIDYVTFFAYAPWTDVEPTTGKIVVPDSILTQFPDSIEKWQTKNIISVNTNSTQGDPIIKYVVDTDPGTSVDLLWGVAAQQADSLYNPIDGAQGSKQANKGVTITPGMPFIDLVKPNNPENDRLVFNLKHALAKVKVTIDYIADKPTPLNGTYAKNQYGADTIPAPLSQHIDSLKTRIFVRSFSIDGWATEGALNLNNTEPGIPLWKDIDGSKDLTFKTVTFFDGLKDGKEGTSNNAQKSETPNGLNPTIIENFALIDTLYSSDATEKALIEKYMGDSIIFRDGTKNLGVPETKDSVLLFGGDDTKNGGYFYVIPRNGGEDVNVKIVYDVETIDSKLADYLSDGTTHGSSITNEISKEAIFGPNIDFEPGYQYWIKIHIGMTSVKIEATVTPWIETGETTVNLPDNQNPDVLNPETALLPAAGTTAAYTAVWKENGEWIPTANGINGTATTTGNFIGNYAEVTINQTYTGGSFDIPGQTVTIVNNDTKFYIDASAKAGDELPLLYYYDADTTDNVEGQFYNTGFKIVVGTITAP